MDEVLYSDHKNYSYQRVIQFLLNEVNLAMTHIYLSYWCTNIFFSTSIQKNVPPLRSSPSIHPKNWTQQNDSIKINHPDYFLIFSLLTHSNLTYKIACMVVSLPISHHTRHPSPSLPTPAPNGQGSSDLTRLRERDRASREAEDLPPPQPADRHHCAGFPHAGRRAPAPPSRPWTWALVQVCQRWHPAGLADEWPSRTPGPVRRAPPCSLPSGGLWTGECSWLLSLGFEYWRIDND
jgi:hypothetical protein